MGNSTDIRPTLLSDAYVGYVPGVGGGGDDVPTLNTWLTSHSGIANLPAGTIHIETNLNIPAGTGLKGSPLGTTLAFSGSGGITINGDDTAITDLIFTDSGSSSGNLIFNVGHNRFHLERIKYLPSGSGNRLCATGWGGVGSVVRDIYASGTTSAPDVFDLYQYTESIVDGVIVDGLSQTVAGNNLTIINSNNMVRCSISSCGIKNCATGSSSGGGAIGLANGSEISVTNCVIQGNTGMDGIGANPCSDLTISNCVITDNAVNASNSNGDALDLFGGNRITVTGCDLSRNGQYGVEIFYNAAVVTDVEVVGNTIESNGLSGVTIIGGQRIIVANNSIGLNNHNGIVTQAGGGSDSKHITILGNRIFNNDQNATGDATPGGIYLSGNTNAVLIEGNDIYDDQGVVTQTNGLQIQNTANDVLVANNRFSVSTVTAPVSTAPIPIFRGNVGYNPIGVVSPAVPASGTAVAAAQYDRTFYVSTVAGTTACSMAIQNGPTITFVASVAQVVAVKVPAGKTVTPTYTGTAPTWVVEGE